MIMKSNMLDGAVRVPLLIRMLGTLVTPLNRRTYDEPVELIDLGPTLVELAGSRISHPKFWTVWRRFSSTHSVTIARTLLSASPRDYALKSVVEDDPNGSGEPYMLFDRTHDPPERRKLAGEPEHRQIERELSARISGSPGLNSINPGGLHGLFVRVSEHLDIARKALGNQLDGHGVVVPTVVVQLTLCSCAAASD